MNTFQHIRSAWEIAVFWKLLRLYLNQKSKNARFCQNCPQTGLFLKQRGLFLRNNPDHKFREFGHFPVFFNLPALVRETELQKRAKFIAKLHQVITVLMEITLDRGRFLSNHPRALARGDYSEISRERGWFLCNHPMQFLSNLCENRFSKFREKGM